MPENLHDTFDASKERGFGLEYAHPQNDTILSECKKILWRVPTGQRLLNVMSQNNIPAMVVSNREINYNVPDLKTVHIFCPKPAPKDLTIVALALALGIRDVEHGMLGYRLKAKNLNEIISQEDSDILLSKTLDIIVTMCKIAEEFHDETGDTKLIDYVQNLGHRELYKAFKDRKNLQELEEIFKRSLAEG